MSTTFGPEIGFGHAKAPLNPWIVKGGLGGNPIQAWLPNNIQGYYDLWDKIGGGLLSLPGRADFQGVLWVHGETDSEVLGLSTAYQANLETLLTYYSMFLRKTTPKFVQSTISASASMAYRANTNTGKTNFTAVDPTNRKLANADTWELKADSTHYTGDGQLALGAAFGALV